jgi:hypothetical protein
MNKLNKKTKLEKQLDAIEVNKQKLSDLRDKIQIQIDELEGIYLSICEGINSFDEGISYFKDGMDELSKFI